MRKVKIYTLSCPITKEVKYVGKTVLTLKQRLNAHCQLKKESNHRYYWIRKLIKDGVKPKIELIEEVDNDGWQFWERWYISLFKSWGFNLVNQSKGGDGFENNHVPWNKGLTGIYTQEQKDYLSRIQKGKVISKETRDKISESTKGKKKKPLSKNTKAKISKANKGKTAWNKGLKLNDKQKRKSREVHQFNKQNVLIKIWASVEEVTLNISKGNIRSVCSGSRNSAGGFIWKWKN